MACPYPGPYPGLGRHKALPLLSLPRSLPRFGQAQGTAPTVLTPGPYPGLGRHKALPLLSLPPVLTPGSGRHKALPLPD